MTSPVNGAVCVARTEGEQRSSRIAGSRGSTRRLMQALQRDEPSKQLANAAFYRRTCCAFRRHILYILVLVYVCVCVRFATLTPKRAASFSRCLLMQRSRSLTAKRLHSEPIAYGDSEDSPGILSEAALPGSGWRD
ncbi:hypothetical protein PO909_017964 [Leuciscus waleckii]